VTRTADGAYGLSGTDNRPVPATWTTGRIADAVHRSVLAPLGFTRRGSMCQRSDAGLRRTLSFHRHPGSRPTIQMLAEVALTELPEPVTKHRRDYLTGSVRSTTGRAWYVLPSSDQGLPPQLLADAAGPVLHFLLRADSLGEFVLWAQDIFLGDSRPGWWGGFEPVIPQGTGPLQAAAFAAAALGDTELVEFLVARVENEEASEHYFDDFLNEMRQLQPQAHHRHPIIRPIRW
jgi:hypothetical protein